MGWLDKELQRHKAMKLVENAMNTPEFKKKQKEWEEEAVLNALGSFAFIACGFLETRHGYKKNGLKKFLSFLLTSMKCSENNELFFKEYDEYFEEEYGFDVLAELGLELKREGKSNG